MRRQYHPAHVDANRADGRFSMSGSIGPDKVAIGLLPDANARDGGGWTVRVRQIGPGFRPADTLVP